MSNVSAVILSCVFGFIFGWLIAGNLFFRSVGVSCSRQKGFFYTLLHLIFWPKWLVIQVRDIREIRQLEKDAEDR